MIERFLFNREWKVVSKWTVLTFDIAIVTLSFILAYLIRFNLSLNFDVDMLKKQIPLVWCMFVLGFLITGSYKGVVRHTGIKDVYNIFNAICLSSIGLIVCIVANRYFGFIDAFTK